MRRLVTVLLGCFLSASAYGQAGDADIRMERSRFYEGDKLLKPREVLTRLQLNTEAFAEFKKAKANYDAAQVLGFVGGFMIGWPLGTALGGGDPQWGIAAGGGALILASLPLNSAFKKRADRALTIYNSNQPAAWSFPIDVRFRFYGAGAGIMVKM